MEVSAELQCPYCAEWQELDLDPETEGSFVQDCSVCCQPWQLYVQWQDGCPIVAVERAQ